MASEEVTLLECNQTKTNTLTPLRKCQILTFLCVLPLALLNVWLKAFSYDSNEHTQVTILMWHEPFGPPAHLFSTDRDHNCSPSCKIVRQRSLFPTADVVVFHNRELITGREKLPMHLPRPPGQRWAWMSLESPVHNGDLRKFAGIFNLTMNYRRDADISIPYGERLAVKSEGENPVQTNTQNKTILACWVVSNYASSYRRSKVHKALSAIVPVKVYGRWTNIPLTSAELLPTISHCYFYLAFENSEAKDYITEKLWKNAYQSGAVPIVLGASMEDYEAVAPPHSFIHVDEFASVKELAAYLQQVAGDQKRYSEYFQWKRNWKTKLNSGWNERLCKICSHFDSLPPNKVYDDLAAWDHATGVA
ncbi:alpha-(1,3)-fucosyltransferase 7 [Hippocampus comes]|uniref:Fucosyltransferase n=1 Tax=Hippocampus comes TaxID=109280 RepID=A0A3Q2ZAJ6_HIPCM|nr:PREDICTED: alpha-(1,3)-fucosyltransferase 7 [Hippocampus comes]XP_019745748.1 PREDICTED: alpha-(1,3)-fucosyltransferase 7 [Hippocampus comes]XP_019745749.1 PREDICTED: alpha-(1,3)-fucosyltransferase 7 [Hippocampus comes]XP_019745750.1 PREDICTED: alpha-(1,3)-fucosyltransferase 7 [Hippocampus comes]